MKSNIFLVTLQEFFHSKKMEIDQQCDACESGRVARKKCIECSDWLCNQCCTLHLKVKITKDHHIVSQADLMSGKFDALLKETFEPLVCSKHNQPLNLYCSEETCSAPICTLCKTTLGHDGHRTIELEEQAVEEMSTLQSLLPNVQHFIKCMATKISNLSHEEKLTAHVRKMRGPDTSPPEWKQPRFNSTADINSELLEGMFGKICFEGEITRSLMSTTFNAKTKFDDKEPALCDVALDFDGNIIVVDRENRRVKIFDGNGNLKMCTAENALRAPNRITYLRESRKILVKDDRALKLIGTDGRIVGPFGDRLKQPVALCQNAQDEVLITEWMGGDIVIYNEKGTRIRSFPCSSEAPGYITSLQNGNIALTDWKHHLVKLFDSSGKFIRQYGSGQGCGVGQLDHPYGLCSDRLNHILVADTWNHRIHLLNEDCRLIKVLLTKDDGLEFPQAVIVNRDGLLVIVEQHGLVKSYQYLV